MPLYEMVDNKRKRFYPPAFITLLEQRFGDKLDHTTGQTRNNRFGYIINMAVYGDERLFEEIVKAADANVIDFKSCLFDEEEAKKRAHRKLGTLLLLVECTRMEMEYKKEEREGNCRPRRPSILDSVYIESKDRKGWPGENFPPSPADSQAYTSNERIAHINALEKAYLTPEARALYEAGAEALSIGRSITKAQGTDIGRIYDAFGRMGEALAKFADIANKLPTS